MTSPLSPGVTRAVVREWLQSKNAVLDAILAGVVEELTPVAMEHAGCLILASIDPDPREALLEDVEQVLCEVMRWLADVDAAEPDAWDAVYWRGYHAVQPRLEEAWAHLAKRRARMRGAQFPEPAAPVLAEGGAS